MPIDAVTRRTVLKSMVAAAVAAAVAPRLLPPMLESIGATADVAETVLVQKAYAFIPVSLELIADGSGLADEIALMVRDAADDFASAEKRTLKMLGKVERMARPELDTRFGLGSWPGMAVYHAEFEVA